MKVRDIMDADAVAIPVGTPYEEVARTLYREDMSGAPVVDANGLLIGTVSEKDLFRILYPFYRSYYEQPESYADLEHRENKIDDIRHHRVEVFMTKDVITVDPEAPVMRAGAIMLARNINRIPVIENGKLVGMVSRCDIFRTILKNHFHLDECAAACPTEPITPL